jgi:hypothetical protein
MKRLTLAALLALAATAAPLTSMAAPAVGVYVGVAPPAPIVERVPAPRHGYMWAPGHWVWNGHRHVWAGGAWIAERPGYAYTAPVWIRSGGGWVLEPEHWRPYRGVERGYERVAQAPRWVGPGYVEPRYARPGHDRDHDGIPDRYEHGPRHDRDGDGVPDRYDGRPDNPYRR